MKLNLANLVTLIRIVMIPLLAIAFYWPVPGSNVLVTTLFVVASLSDWADGYIARRFNQASPFGAFLDPVADKLMVATVLILVTQSYNDTLITLSAAIIVGREITISALREWMSELGEGARIKVAMTGKIKTAFQMIALGFLLYHENLWFIPVALIGRIALIAAAVLTLWSMLAYLRSAWPAMQDSDHRG